MCENKIAVTLFNCCAVMILSSLNAGETPKIHARNNVLVAVSYNARSVSNNITLIVQIEANGENLVDEGISQERR